MVRGPSLVDVAPGVLVATSAVYATTTTVLVGDDGACLVVDPGVTADEVDAIGAALRHAGLRPVAVWSTHDHWDHRLDGDPFDGCPRWSGTGSSVASTDLARQRDEDAELARVLTSRRGDRPARIAPAPRTFPRGATHRDGWVTLDWPGPVVMALVHDAHAAGSSALWLPGAGVVVAGDLLSDVEIPLLALERADPLTEHHAVLDALAATRADLVVPGHGSPGDLAARVAADRAYLHALLDDGATPDPRARAGWLRDEDARQRTHVRGR